MRIHVFIVAAIVIVLGVVIALTLTAKQTTAGGVEQQQVEKDNQSVGQRRAEMMKWAADWDS